MNYNNPELPRLFGDRTPEVVEAFKELVTYMDKPQDSLSELTDPKQFRRMRLSCFENHMRRLDIALALREYRKRIEANTTKGVHVRIAPGDIAMTLRAEYSVLGQLGKPIALGSDDVGNRIVAPGSSAPGSRPGYGPA